MIFESRNFTIILAAIMIAVHRRIASHANYILSRQERPITLQCLVWVSSKTQQIRNAAIGFLATSTPSATAAKTPDCLVNHGMVRETVPYSPENLRFVTKREGTKRLQRH